MNNNHLEFCSNVVQTTIEVHKSPCDWRKNCERSEGFAPGVMLVSVSIRMHVVFKAVRPVQRNTSGSLRRVSWSASDTLCCLVTVVVTSIVIWVPARMDLEALGEC